MSVRQMLRASAEKEASVLKKSAIAPVNSDSEERPKRHPGGRPSNKEKGIEGRKQYTLTLKESTYAMILSKAREEEISFAKFMERAALEYIEDHK